MSFPENTVSVSLLTSLYFLFLMLNCGFTVESPTVTCLREPQGVCYVGSLNRTKNGSHCLPWRSVMDSASQRHLYTEKMKHEYHAWPQAEKDTNACRNLDKRGIGPWCFVVNGEKGNVTAMSCEIPVCNQTVHVTCKQGRRGFGYIGPLNYSAGGTPCLAWRDVMESETFASHPIVNRSAAEYGTWTDTDKESNLCRNPDFRQEGPWCFVRPNLTEEMKALARTMPFLLINVKTCDIPECYVNSLTYVHVFSVPSFIEQFGQTVLISCGIFVGEKCERDDKGHIVFHRLRQNGKREALKGNFSNLSYLERTGIAFVVGSITVNEELAGDRIECSAQLGNTTLKNTTTIPLQTATAATTTMRTTMVMTTPTLLRTKSIL